ncbi:hypothetical protein GRI97_15555 [Altererythrobacter xixiisoli]|uniref:Uncharacterized protein n=1 Tax=Croceibacterium xixiisoli TaxID=1476466 RepID=A0A6I4TWJ3_9SPHN|nr:hypothetical protein [Croceibacterium xixiisoli]
MQAGVAVPPPESESLQTTDVAFEEIANGQNAAAIAALQERLAAEPSDPALLINLGAAYQRSGDSERAAAAYRAAADSSTRYQLELADGSWMDSRHAARLAMHSLDRTTLALR